MSSMEDEIAVKLIFIHSVNSAGHHKAQENSSAKILAGIMS